MLNCRPSPLPLQSDTQLCSRPPAVPSLPNSIRWHRSSPPTFLPPLSHSLCQPASPAGIPWNLPARQAREAGRLTAVLPLPSSPLNPIPSLTPTYCRHSPGTCWPSLPEKQVGQQRRYLKLQSLPLPPFLQVQSPCCIPGSVAISLLWPLLVLCPHSQGNKQILVAHTVFFPPVEPLTTFLSHPHS